MIPCFTRLINTFWRVKEPLYQPRGERSGFLRFKSVKRHFWCEPTRERSDRVRERQKWDPNGF
jgi:hypothetical protein